MGFCRRFERRLSGGPTAPSFTSLADSPRNITALRGIRVGIAGWSNPPALRAERPQDQTPLAYYAAHFSCVEINSSFHRPHGGSTYARWRDETPPQFQFSVKMPRSITHESRLRRTAAEVSRFYAEIDHLKPKLAAVLVQLPPSLEYSTACVRSFFRGVPRVRGTVVTCEPRHVSWFSKRADEALNRLEVSRVAADPVGCSEANAPGACIVLHTSVGTVRPRCITQNTRMRSSPRLP